MILLSELQYCPPTTFFAELLRADALLLEAQEHYQKQTYRNRCLIRTAQGVQPLTVPVVDGNRSEKVRTADIAIDYSQNWVHRHLRTLQTAYGNSPYFEYYADYLRDIYVQKPVRLFDLNRQLLDLLLRCFRLTLPITYTTEYRPHPAPPRPAAPLTSSPNFILDRRDCLTPKSARSLTLPDSPADAPALRPYPQVFGPGFEPGLSVLDLLFSQGPAASQFL